MGAGGSKNREQVTRARGLETRVAELQAVSDQRKQEADAKISHITELEERITELEEEVEQAKEARDRANEQKKEWQLQAASTQSRLEKYRDRFEVLLEKQKREADAKFKSEVQMEIGRMEMTWRDQLRREKETRTQYERMLLSAGYTPAQIASGALPQIANLSGKEKELNDGSNASPGPLLPLPENYPKVQFYALANDAKPADEKPVDVKAEEPPAAVRSASRSSASSKPSSGAVSGGATPRRSMIQAAKDLVSAGGSKK